MMNYPEPGFFRLSLIYLRYEKDHITLYQSYTEIIMSLECDAVLGFHVYFCWLKPPLAYGT